MLLQNGLGSDKVSAVGCHTGFSFAKLLNAWAWPSRRPAPPVGGDRILLTPDDVRALKQVADECIPRGLSCANNFHEIIDMALRSLRRDLDSDCEAEVIEDVRLEVGYRLWCAREGLSNLRVDISLNRST